MNLHLTATLCVRSVTDGWWELVGAVRRLSWNDDPGGHVTYPPQQPPFGNQDPYGQYGNTAQFGGGGYPPPPPPKKNTGAIVAVIVAVLVVVAGVGITGFVAPGFFLADEQTPPPTTPKDPPKTGSSSAEPKGGDGPEETLEAVADGLASQDADGLKDLACADARSGVDEAIDDLDAVDDARLVDSREEADDEAVGLVEVTVGTESGKFEVTVVDDGGWCWQDITGPIGNDPEDPTTSTAPPPPGSGDGTPTAGGKPVEAAALAYAQSFLDAVNGGDPETAKTMLCTDGNSTAADVDELFAADPQNLAINPEVDGNTSSPESYQLYLSGTVDGRELQGHESNLWIVAYSGSWCVHGFRA